jgi:transcriptional regulator with XRE-family HTH domain
MKFREDFTQEEGASKAGISVISARRIESGRHQSKKASREWRTRPDSLEAAKESIVVPILQ